MLHGGTAKIKNGRAGCELAQRRLRTGQVQEEDKELGIDARRVWRQDVERPSGWESPLGNGLASLSNGVRLLSSEVTIRVLRLNPSWLKFAMLLGT